MEKIKELKKGNIEEYDIDRYWLVFYQLYLDGLIKAPPYRDELDNKIFEILKKEKVSFVEYEHEDLRTWPERMFGSAK